MKIPTLDEVHAPLQTAKSEASLINAKANSIRNELYACAERIRTNKPVAGNALENKSRETVGLDRLPEVLPDSELHGKLSSRLSAISRQQAITVGVIQRERDIASVKLCSTLAPHHASLVKDVAENLSALHVSLTKYFGFLDEVESTGAATTALRPIFPDGFHPFDTSGRFHFAFKEMRENGHITMRDIPEAVR